ncbi:Succinate dehydrogenase assembly factor 2 mitochondrial [Coemansia spiralis]|uniref:Succinate dehydrogenase assembly factor 2, mitochondrial n=2 Tax=Coemansia TaxID=4863 RepID=A0A9W8GBH4_9FUNG|nr:Flavinator of succinate dehydrogenase-domain-containing protein [Coemansia spiralis]KAJ1992724.1 Succinate dehydrogenase assembly factor 2 mitochondrial [Coemansia umbellata]KAJ2623310.1 Succinate dehydrogenase assembly factor 2 mitochondrial [Coemansia sp. RSA 1358]KAJ2678861.1 Succinate dehydrogenase assembly factor 2 mitochondrial [Coemansia spiralis]
MLAFSILRSTASRTAAVNLLRVQQRLPQAQYNSNGGSTSDAPEIPNELGLERKQRTGEDVETVRRRLQYQMRKRGILETDLLLSTFASEQLKLLSREELDDLDSLLSNVDWDIFYWATGKSTPPESVQLMAVFQKLKQHASKRGKTIMRMPDLDDDSKK